LINAGMKVAGTNTQPGSDANSVLQDPRQGRRALQRLLATPASAALSFEGEVARLSGLPETGYEKARKTIAAAYGVRVGHLDREVGKRRARTLPAAKDVELASPYPNDPPWSGDVELGELLDETLVEAKRYTVASEPTLALLATWTAHAHIVHNPQVKLQKSPRLAISAREKGSGKTVTLEVIACLSPRARAASSYTASSVFRSLAADHPTLCLDEANVLLRDETKSDIVSVLNCGDRRASAWIDRSVPTSQGGWRVERFNVFGAVALAGIDELPETLQDRSVRLFLKKVPGDQVPEHLRDGSSSKLIELRRRFAAWGEKLAELPPDPAMPSILLRQAGRIGDNWRPLFGIAELAGGRWPKLLEVAVLAELDSEQRLSLFERLLRSIYIAFTAELTKHDDLQKQLGAGYEQDDFADNPTRLQTGTLLEYLINDKAEEWDRIHRGKPITAYWLREQLRGILVPPKTQDWWRGSGKVRKHYSGYLHNQFEAAWTTHPPPAAARDPEASTLSSTTPLPASGASGASGAEVDFPSKTAKKPAPDETASSGDAPDASSPAVAPDRKSARPDTQFRSGADLAAENLRRLGRAPDAPDAPDLPRGECEDKGAIAAQNGTERRAEPSEKGEKDRIVSGALPPLRQARRRRKPPDGEAAPDLGLPPASVPPYQPGAWEAALVDEVRRLHQQNPKRSIAWLGKRTGQPRSVVQAILRLAGAAE
jgi:hypothetical protein